MAKLKVKKLTVDEKLLNTEQRLANIENEIYALRTQERCEHRCIKIPMEKDGWLPTGTFPPECVLCGKKFRGIESNFSWHAKKLFRIIFKKIKS